MDHFPAELEAFHQRLQSVGKRQTSRHGSRQFQGTVELRQAESTRKGEDRGLEDHSLDSKGLPPGDRDVGKG